MNRRRLPWMVALVAIVVVAGGQTTDAASRTPGARDNSPLYDHLSQSVAMRHWAADPSSAPARLRKRVQAVMHAAQPHDADRDEPDDAAIGHPFNRDRTGLAQNEESLAVCRSDPAVVLGGTNDSRGLLDPDGNSTGWHLSINGGSAIANEGLLPAVQIGPAARPSGGDPASAIDEHCNLFAASLNYDPIDPTNSNGVVVYRSTPEVLSKCPGGADASCWPARRVGAAARPGHFLDQDWMGGGRSGGAGEVGWVSWPDVPLAPPPPTGISSESIMPARCDGR